ncbi:MULTISPECIES: HNH endonuclease [unclassified Afipia]|uniref:HNH endonuclease n=1 Tax=unclassified Afipia TaxID=2642050 RepID=UPI00041D86DB|nr:MULTISPECIES: HNH endonuclease [unclassified Afipia]
MRPDKKLLDELLTRSGGRCPVCATPIPPFSVSHIIPQSLGGSSDIENLTLVCPNCNAVLGASELHFVEYLTSLLSANPNFSQIEQEGIIPGTRYRADIKAIEDTPHGKRVLAIECKRFSVISGPQVYSTLKHLLRHQIGAIETKSILAFPGRASPEVISKFSEHSIEVWDIDQIASLFGKQIEESDDPYFKSIFSATRSRASQQERFIADLKSCNSGVQQWSDYQKLVGRILEHLFCPTLRAPLTENSDHTKTNRRDFIFPNYAPDGFWHFLRTRYAADYIVVDAKNGKKRVTKTNVLQVANYLKPHGTGMFGIILCRIGADRGAETTIREQWLLHNKLVLILTDIDLENMLLASAAAGDPTTIISERIQQFRLSI